MLKKILVVDDNEDVGQIIREDLSENGYDITVVLSAEDAIEKIKSQHFDLLITDIILPGMSGIELIAIVRRDYQHLKILACSGGGEAGEAMASLAIEQAEQEGALCSMIKPFMSDELSKKVNLLLS